MKRFLIVFMFLIFVYCLFGCKTHTTINDQGSENKINEIAREIESIEKTSSDGLIDTYTITFSDGSTTTFTITKGEDELDAKDPIVEIGENGNIFVNGKDTNIKAEGEKGEDGLSAYELYKKYNPEYEGTEEEWVKKFFSDESELDIFVSNMNHSNFTINQTIFKGEQFYSEEIYEMDNGLVHWKIKDPRIKIKDTEPDSFDVSEYYFNVNDLHKISDLISFIKERDEWYLDTDSFEASLVEERCDSKNYDLKINPEYFEETQKNTFVVKDELVSEVGKSIYTDRDDIYFEGTPSEEIAFKEVFTSLSIQTINGNLFIEATASIIDEDETYEITYNTTISKIGVTRLSAPTYEKTNKGGPPEDTISDCYRKEDGDNVDALKGIVKAYETYGRYSTIYISDYDDNSISIILKDNLPKELEVFDRIQVYGRLEIKNGLHQVVVDKLSNLKIFEISSAETNTINNLKDINKHRINEVINLNGVSLDKVTVENKEDIILKDRMSNTIKLSVLETQVSFFNKFLEERSIDEDIDLNNVVISIKDDEIYISLTDQTNISLQYGLLLSYTSKTINEELSLEEALSDLNVIYRVEGGEYRTLNNDEYLISSLDYDSSKNGQYSAKITYNNIEASIIVTVFYREIKERVSYDVLEKVAKENGAMTPGLPSTGNVNVLVIPIGFNNSNYGSNEAVKEKLNCAFNGTKEETGWYSLKEYYMEASYGKLNITANILDIYNTDVDYDLENADYDDAYDYFINSLTFYDSIINYVDYDQNNDGYIDYVYLVYLAPYKKDDTQSKAWWAYSNVYYGLGEFDNKEPRHFMWTSIEFFNEPIIKIYDGDEIDEENSTYVNINCETIIHETGHALGLDDYYDYELGGVKGGIGSFTMMDANQGDLDPYSKAILGWTNPTVVAGLSLDVTISSFEATGDTIIISKYNKETYFEEYYMIALYTPTGTNELKKDANKGLPSKTGIMLWHINAKLKGTYAILSEEAYDITKYNNGSASIKLIDLVCADGSDDIDKSSSFVVSDKDLFAANSTILDLYWYDGSEASVIINISDFESIDGIERTTLNIVFD